MCTGSKGSPFGCRSHRSYTYHARCEVAPRLLLSGLTEFRIPVLVASETLRSRPSVFTVKPWITDCVPSVEIQRVCHEGLLPVGIKGEGSVSQGPCPRVFLDSRPCPGSRAHGMAAGCSGFQPPPPRAPVSLCTRCEAFSQTQQKITLFFSI